MATISDLERVGQLLMALGRRSSLRDPIAGFCEQLQLTPAQIHAVIWLGRDGPLTMGELAQRLRCTEKTLTGLVDRLEREGFAKRTRDAQDRRVVHVTLTRKGTVAHRKLDERMRSKLACLISLLDPPERQALIRILEKLLQAAGAEAPALPGSRKTA